jgi:hypothetical protein
LVAQVSVLHDGLRAEVAYDVCPTFLDLSQRVVVRDLLELSTAFRPHALQGVVQAVGVVVVLGIILELHAKPTARHRMIRIAGNLYELAVLHVIQKRAGVGTVLGTSPPHDPGFAYMGRHSRSPEKAIRAGLSSVLMGRGNRFSRRLDHGRCTLVGV